MPTIREQFLDSVVYLYETESDAEHGEQTGGLGFLIGVPGPRSPHYALHLYVVTNKHVIEGGYNVVRLTQASDRYGFRQKVRPDETVIMSAPREEWRFPAVGDDLAIWHLGVQRPGADVDFAYVPHEACVREIDHVHYGPGDDCFMVGRFVTHAGTQKNLPTARFGNISMMPLEKIRHRGVDVDAFLVETRSQAGYSGSPVFVYRQKTTIKVPIREPSAYKRAVREIELTAKEQYDIRLLGIDCAHLPNWAQIKDKYRDQHPQLPPDARVELGTGMLVVVPAWKLTELLNREDVRGVREAEAEREETVEDVATAESQGQATADLMGKSLQVPKDEADEVHRGHQP